MPSSEPIYCPHCGAEGQTGAYCTECGESIRDAGDRTDSGGADAAKPQGSEVAVDRSELEPETNATNDDELITGKRLVIAGAAIAAIGAFLPWFSASAVGTTVEVSGVERDGIFTLVFAVAAGAIGWHYGDRSWGRWPAVGVVVLGGLIAFFGGAYIYDPWLGTEPPREEVQNAVQIGVGLYATLIGGALVAAGPMYDYSQTRGPSQDTSSERAPTWPLWVLITLVPTWAVGLVAFQTGGWLAPLAFLAVVASLPILYLDAKWASEAGELEMDYPIILPFACLLFWVFAVPFYVFYRYRNR